MANVGDRVSVVNCINPVFNGCKGVVVSVTESGLFNTIELDPEYVTEERRGFLWASIVVYGRPLLVALDAEIEVAAKVAVITVGTEIVVTDGCFDPAAVGLIGTVREVTDYGDYLVQFEISNHDDLEDHLIVAMRLNRMVFGFYGLPLERQEIETF